MNSSNPSLDSQRILVFITAEYPFGKQETFIEDEINFLSDAFDQVIVLPKNTPGPPRKMPKNCIIGTPFAQRSRPRNMALFWNEMLNLRGHLTRTKIAYRSWQGVGRRAAQIKASVHEVKGEIIYYSYWLDEGAVAIAQLGQSEGHLAVSRAHGWDVYPERHPHKYLPFRRFLSTSPLSVFPISNDGLSALKRQGFQNLKCSYLGTNFSKKSISIGDEQNPQQKILVSVSSIIELKRVQRIAEIFLQLKALDPSWEWHHFGDGPLEGVLRIWLEGKATESYYLHGRQSNKTVREWLFNHKDIALFINQSTTEGLPVSMMEAMSYGIPCVGTEVGGVSEIITHKHNGLLHKADENTEQVAMDISQIESAHFVAMRKCARITWEKSFDAEKNYKGFIKELTTLSRATPLHKV